MTALEQFAYGNQRIRSILIDGNPWFVAGDVAKILGYRDANALTRRVEPEDKATRILSTPGGAQSMTIINEPGLYTGVLGSTVTDARDFKIWVVREILPAIRKTGSFSTAAPAELSRIEILTMALESETRALAAESKIAELEPAAEAWQGLAGAVGDYEVGDAAKILARAGVETGRQRLFEQMARLGWTHRGASGRWKAYQTAVDSGYLTEKPQSHPHPRSGEIVLDPPQVRVTVRGLDRLRVRLGTLKMAVAS